MHLEPAMTGDAVLDERQDIGRKVGKEIGSSKCAKHGIVETDEIWLLDLNGPTEQVPWRYGECGRIKLFRRHVPQVVSDSSTFKKEEECNEFNLTQKFPSSYGAF